MSPTQLQELELTIRQRREYLRQQDSKIQQNQQLLTQQNKQLTQNEALLSRQKSKLEGLTVKADKALQSLQKRAERELSVRAQRLTAQCEALQLDIQRFTKQKQELLAAIDATASHLETLEMDIIEADAIHQDLQDEIEACQRQLRQAARDADYYTKQVHQNQELLTEVLSQLQLARDQKIDTDKEHDRVTKLIAQLTQEVVSLTNELADKKDELAATQRNLSAAQRSLSELIKKDKLFRKGLASEKLRLAQQKDDIKSMQAALDKNISARQQLQPKWQPPKPDELKHFTL